MDETRLNRGIDIPKNRDGTGVPSPTKGKGAVRWRRHSKSQPPPKIEAIQEGASLRLREAKDAR